MLQAPMFECFSFDPFSSQQDGLTTPAIYVCGCEVFQALVISLVVVMTDERIDLRFQVAGQIIVFQQNAVFECLMPTLNLALRMSLIRRAAAP